MGQTVAKGYGLVDLNVKFNQEKAISYSYEAELGTLDYALANPALADKVVAVADWHINSFESNLFEYGSAYTGDLIKSDNPFSASDHDPVIVDLKLKEASKGVAAPWAPCCWPCCRSPGGAVAKTRHPRCQVQSPR